jgi:hypothetical protein
MKGGTFGVEENGESLSRNLSLYADTDFIHMDIEIKLQTYFQTRLSGRD